MRAAPVMHRPAPIRQEETICTAARNRVIDESSLSGGLDFPAFCSLLRERAPGEQHTPASMRRRFNEIDIDRSGRIDKDEYFRWVLRGSLVRSSTQFCRIFEQWDTDSSGSVEQQEFRQAVCALGFDDVPRRAIDAFFAEFDVDGSGRIDRRELERHLKQLDGILVEQRHLIRRVSGGVVGAAFSTSVQLDRSSGVPVADQLRDFLSQHAVRVIDLFRSWDEDGDGAVSRAEFVKAMAPLGLDVSGAEAGALFDTFDADGSGTIDFAELRSLLRKRPPPNLNTAPKLPPDLHTLPSESRHAHIFKSTQVKPSMRYTMDGIAALDAAHSLPPDASRQFAHIAATPHASTTSHHRSTSRVPLPPPLGPTGTRAFSTPCTPKGTCAARPRATASTAP